MPPGERSYQGFVTLRDPIRTGMTLHSVTKMGLGCRALRKPAKPRER